MVTSRRKPRRILLIAPPRTTLLDLAGPHEVFERAARHAPGAYAVQTVATGRSRSVVTKFGLPIQCDLTLSRVRLPVDTVIVAGSDSATEGPADPALRRWLRTSEAGVRRLCSVCTGAFDLAAAGVLEGRRATTHWRHLDAFRARHPGVKLEPDPVYTRDGHVYTSAGITAGIDLALALVEEDCGPAIAQAVARELVVFMQRPGSQAQLSAALSLRMSERDPLRHLQQWVPDHLEQVRTVEDLARLADMSLRNFARWFRRETGTTPAAWLRTLRLEAARRRLHESAAPVPRIAAQSGYGSDRSLRRALAQRGQAASRLRRRPSRTS